MQLQFITVKGHRLKSEMTKKKSTQDRIRERPGIAFSRPLPDEWHRRHLFLPVTVHDNTREVLPTKEACPRLDVQGSYWGVSQVGVTGFPCSWPWSLAPPDVKLLLHNPTSPPT